MVLTVAVGILLSVGALFAVPKQYSATVDAFVLPTGTTSDTTAAYQGGLPSEQRVKTYVQLFQGGRVSDIVVDRLRLPETAAEVTRHISVRLPAGRPTARRRRSHRLPHVGPAGAAQLRRRRRHRHRGRVDPLPAVRPTDPQDVQAARLHPVLERRLSERSRLSGLTTLRYLRSRAKRLPTDLRDTALALGRRPAPWRTEVLRLLVGYSNSLDLPLTPFAERAIDVNFAGSVENRSYTRRSPAYWVGTPKEVARRRMMHGLREWRGRHPEAQVHLRVTDSYEASTADDLSAYSGRLMNSRVCLAPRGATIETYRVFEGLRYGCVVVSDPLPDTWYLCGAPVIQIEDWADLPAVLDDLTADPTRLQRLHEAALRFYRERCSGAVVGSFVAAAVV